MTKPDPAADLSACVQALQDIIAAPGEAAAIAEKALAGIVMARLGVAAGAPGRLSVRIPAQIDNIDLAWAKWVLRCNPKGAGGYKFEGPFLKLGQPAPLPPGAVVMLAVKSGVKRQQTHAIAQIVQDGGELSGWSGPPVHRFNWDDLADRIDRYLANTRQQPLFRDRVLPGPKPPPPNPPAIQAMVDQVLAEAGQRAAAQAQSPDHTAAESPPRSDAAG